jgi:hypothetical protein
MSNMSLVKCPDPTCGAWNSKTDTECAQCGLKFGNHTHKQDTKWDRRRPKQRFDDENDDDGDMNGSGHSRPRR